MQAEECLIHWKYYPKRRELDQLEWDAPFFTWSQEEISQWAVRPSYNIRASLGEAQYGAASALVTGFMRSELCALGLLHLVLYSCCHCSVPRPNSFPPGLPRTECWDILYFYRPASYDFLYVLFFLISTCTCGFANSVLSRTECKCIRQFLSRLCWIKNNLKTLSTQI